MYNENQHSRRVVRFVDVGQGDAILITVGEGKHLLIDGGAHYEIDHYLSKFLPIGSCVLQMAVVTHDHADHSVGVERVKKRCKQAIDGWNLYKGSSFKLEGVNFFVLWPPSGSSFSDINDTSLVILMQYGNFDLLLTGDASKEVLCSIDLSKISGDLEVLKVSHHGSNTGLCEKIIPKVAVVSVGENKFGHPSKKVMEFYRRNDVKIYSTRADGTVEIPF